MASLVTGATGFIGRHLVARLLARGERVHVVARSTSLTRARELFETELVDVVEGDVELPLLGVSEDWIAATRGTVERVFHLAALYDLRAQAQDVERAREDRLAGSDIEGRAAQAKARGA